MCNCCGGYRFEEKKITQVVSFPAFLSSSNDTKGRLSRMGQPAFCAMEGITWASVNVENSTGKTLFSKRNGLKLPHIIVHGLRD